MAHSLGMNKTHGGSGSSTAAKKRRKRRKKKQGESNDNSGGMSVEEASQVGSAASNVNLLMKKLKAHGDFSTEQIEACMNLMFEKGLAYDNFDAVLMQLRISEASKTAPSNPTIQDPPVPVGNNQNSEPEIAICELEEPPVSCPSDASSEKRDWQEPPGSSTQSVKSHEEIIESLLNDKNNLDSVLDGLIIWLSSASTDAKQQFVSSSSLDQVLECILTTASSAENFSLASLTSLDRRLCEMLSQLFGLGMKDGLAKQSLSKGVEALKGIISYSRKFASIGNGEASVEKSQVMEIKELARLMSKVIKDSFKNKYQSANGVPFVRRGNSYSDLSTEANVLDRDVATLAPRGDAIQLNNSGKLTTGDVKRLFKLRDKSNRAANSSVECYELVKSSEDSAELVANKPTVPISVEVTDLVAEVESRASTSTERSKELQQELSETESKLPAELEPIETEKAQLEEEARELRSELVELMKRVEEVRGALEAKEEALTRCDSEMSNRTSLVQKARKDVQKNLDQHRSQMQMVELEKKVCLELQNLATAVARASSGLGPDAAKPSVNSPGLCKEKLELQWHARSILSIDRYMGVEAKCIEFMRERIRKASVDAVELEKQRQSTIAIPTLQEKTLSMLSKLHSNIAEDENTVAFLLDQARDVLKRLETLVAQNTEPERPIASALARISQNAKTLGLSNCFNYDAPEPEKPEVNTPKPTLPTWGGWGKGNGTVRAAKSLVQIQKEEEEQMQVQSSSSTSPPQSPVVEAQEKAKENGRGDDDANDNDDEDEKKPAEHQQPKTPATEESAAKEDTTAEPFEQPSKPASVPNGHTAIHAGGEVS